MGIVNYAPIIDDMTWSYSRIKAFEDCPYRWYLKYIRRIRGSATFFASYGSFVHELLSRYFSGGVSRAEIVESYLLHFKDKVCGDAPNQKVFSSYFHNGLHYLKTIEKFECETIGVERRVNFNIGGLRFRGFIDFIGRGDDGIYVVDHKSRNLKPRSGRSKNTRSDAELDEYLKQLYLYSVAIKQEFGITPSALCFNCFRAQRLIKEPFNELECEKAVSYAKDSVERIRSERDFRPDIDYFKCNFLCDMKDQCEYFELSNRGRR